MRVPVKSEADAFRLTFGIVAVVLAAVVLRAGLDPLVGVAPLVGAAIGGLAWGTAPPGVVLGAVLARLVGVARLVGGAIGVRAWEIAPRDPARATRRDAHRHEHEADGRHRILVIANQTVVGEELREVIAEHAGH